MADALLAGWLMLDRTFMLRQTAELIRLGVDIHDIERTLTWIDATLPQGQQPSTWMPSANDLVEDVAATVSDARLNWYSKRSVGARFKRILDAKETSNAV